MKVNELRAMSTLTVWLRPVPKETSFVPGMVTARVADRPGEYLFTQGENVWLARLCTDADRDALDHQLMRNNASIVAVSQSVSDGSFETVFRFYNGRPREMGILDVFVDEKIKKNMSRRGATWKQGLEQQFLLADDKSRFVILPPAFTNERDLHGFALVGRDRMLITRQTRYNDRQVLVAEDMKPLPDCGLGAVELAYGTLHFSDGLTAEGLSQLALEQMKKLYGSGSNYLEIWDRYGEKEREILLRKAREIMAIDYHSMEEGNNRFTMYISDSIPDALEEDMLLDVMDSAPLYLLDPTLTWEGCFEGTRAKTAEVAPENSGNKRDNAGVHGTAKVASINRAMKYIELEKDNATFFQPPARGVLVYSLLGDQIQAQRRKNAREMIATCRSANPQLGILMTKDGEMAPAKARKESYPPLSPFVKEKIFKHGCTDNQAEAISIALNTPDIALIQGPPGTGKTTVITAILERLNEILDSRSARGNVLVSAFQHDAVINLGERITINNVPLVKYGKKRGSREAGHEKLLTKWRDALVEKIRARHPNLLAKERQISLAEKFAAYMASPLEANEEAFLEAVLALPPAYISPETINRAVTALARLRKRLALIKNVDTSALLRVACSLRVEEAGYADDGAVNALVALRVLPGEMLDEHDRRLLESGPAGHAGGPGKYFEDAALLRQKLLTDIQQPVAYTVPVPRQEILDIYNEIRLQELDDPASEDEDAITAQLLRSLEYSPAELTEAIGEANLVYAATVQQAVGKEIGKAKRKNAARLAGERGGPRYDTVIIDEAARPSPLDLMIPMTMGASRIILVGDHEQLPHILDDAVAKALEEGMEAAEAEKVDATLKKSLFQYLFEERLPQLTAKDGIVRAVTLNTQYRMHPLLGDFVSRQFYKGKVASGLPASMFAHTLPDLDGCPLAWLDVPADRGGEKIRQGHIRERLAEAVAIVAKLKHWMADPASADLTFGVISFYRGQADLIRNEALKQNLCVDHDGRLEVLPEYIGSGNVLERLRINTVDAFQGMEFDVVFLSMVRCVPGGIDAGVAATALPKIFGHLMSPQRLCVSMSRQKKVLVVAGDSAMLKNKVAKKAVPALVAFLELCGQEGKML